jgi:hypothetical protein
MTAVEHGATTNLEKPINGTSFDRTSLCVAEREHNVTLRSRSTLNSVSWEFGVRFARFVLGHSGGLWFWSALRWWER